MPVSSVKWRRTASNSTVLQLVAPQVARFLMETAKWAKFIAIVMIVFGALIVLIAIFGGSVIATLLANSGGPMGILGGGTIIGFYLITAAFILIPNLYLLKFANSAANSLRSGNENELTNAFSNLKSYYKFNGIVMAIVIGFYALILVIALFSSLI